MKLTIDKPFAVEVEKYQYVIFTTDEINVSFQKFIENLKDTKNPESHVIYYTRDLLSRTMVHYSEKTEQAVGYYYDRWQSDIYCHLVEASKLKERYDRQFQFGKPIDDCVFKKMEEMYYEEQAKKLEGVIAEPTNTTNRIKI